MSITQNNVNGDNIANLLYQPSIDIGRLRSIVENEGNKVKTLLANIGTINRYSEDDNFIAISEKNKLNELNEYYDVFIKKNESKLIILHDFFCTNDLSEVVDGVAEHLKEIIFSFENQNSLKLTPQIISFIVNEHTKAFTSSEDKDITTLCVYYLYRFCFIGKKA